jgi:hypothetical protein
MNSALFLLLAIVGIGIVAGMMYLRSAVRMSDEQARREAGVTKPDPVRVEPKGREW